MASIEIVDLIQQNLEQNGILSRIREELLASVINVLNSKDFVETTKMDEVVESKNGNLALQLVLELMYSLGLRKSHGMMLAEIGGNFSTLSRAELKSRINAGLVDGQPLLISLLETAPDMAMARSGNEESKSPPTAVSSGVEKHLAAVNSKKSAHSEAKPVGLSHAEDTLMVDSDLEESVDNDHFGAASTSSVGSSSLNSLGSARHKGLAPLAPIHAVGKTAQKALPSFPTTATSGSKHLAPLTAPSTKQGPLDSSPGFTSRTGSLSLGASEDKLSSGSLLEQSAESVQEDLNAKEDDGEEPLSPYGGMDHRARGNMDDAFEGSAAVESSFEENSYVEKEHPMTTEPESPRRRYVKSVEVGARSLDAQSDDEDDDIQEAEAKTTRGVVKASVSSASVTRSKAGWDVVEDDDVDYEINAGSPDSYSARPTPSSPAHHDEDIVYDNYEDDMRGATENSFEYDQGDSGIRESRADSVDTVSRLRPTREAFGAPTKRDLPPLNKGNKSTGHVASTGHDWDMVLSPNEDSEAFPDDEELYESVVEDDEDGEEAALNISRRSNQEEDEEEQMAMKHVLKSAPDLVAQNDSVDSKALADDDVEEEEEDYDDDYGDDFEDGGDEDAEKELPAPAPIPTGKNLSRAYDRLSDDDEEGSIESIEELEEDISVGMASSEEDEDGDRGGFGGGMARSSSGMLPQTSSSRDSNLPERNSDDTRPVGSGKVTSAMRDFDDNSDDEELGLGPETGSATSEDIEQLDFSVGSGDSESNSFLHEDISSSRKGPGESTEFSASENEISGSHGLDGFDYTTNAVPPPRRGGW